MLTNQELIIDGNNVKLKNTFNIGIAKSLAADESKDNNRRRESRCLGHIPPEMWSYDPWLLAAKKLLSVGEHQKYNDMMRKFFEVHPQLSVAFSKQVWCMG